MQNEDGMEFNEKFTFINDLRYSNFFKVVKGPEGRSVRTLAPKCNLPQTYNLEVLLPSFIFNHFYTQNLRNHTEITDVLIQIYFLFTVRRFFSELFILFIYLFFLPGNQTAPQLDPPTSMFYSFRGVRGQTI